MPDTFPLLLAQSVGVSDGSTLGVLLIVFGGAAGACFYLPFLRVKKWAWESYWLVYAIVALIILPWCLIWFISPNVLSVLAAAPKEEIRFCFLCGVAWGFGAMSWGLMIRYLGIGLGLAIGCGLCAATGTLLPPLIKGEFAALLQSSGGLVSLGAVTVSLLGIVSIGAAGMGKERELLDEQKKVAVAEYNFIKGLCVAIFSGLMSSAMSFGLQGGATIEGLTQTIEPITPHAWRGLPVLAVTLAGGFLVEAGWCLVLNFKNRTYGDYANRAAPRAANYLLAAAAGAIWLPNLLCYIIGVPFMGRISYLAWSVLMASLIFFSTALGVILGEWRGTSPRTRRLLALGLILLAASAALSGYSGFLHK